MKKNIKLICLTMAIFALTACSNSTPTNQNGNNAPAKKSGLKVGTCNELFASMRKNDAKSPDEELYRAAAVILFTDTRDTEAKNCCDNIKEEKLKKECRRE